jgi:ketosteroid isomerase-like protein
VNPGDPDDNPNARNVQRQEAVRGWFGGLASTRDYTAFEPREFIAQNDKVVSLLYSEATVRDTGRAFINHEAHVWTLRDGNSPDSRTISTPQRRKVPTAWSSPARDTGGSYVAWASVLSPDA